MSALELYWITRLDGIRAFLSIALFIDIIYLIVYGVIFCGLGFDSNEQEDFEALKSHKKAYKIPIVIFVISVLGLLFIPTSSELMIFGGIDKLSNSPEINNLVGLIYEKLQSLLMSK